MKADKRTEDAAEFWRSVEQSAAAVRDLPAWMKAGLVVDRTNFVTFDDDELSLANQKR